MTGFPLPGTGRVAVVAPAPAPRPRSWAGAPSAALDPDGGFALAYRLRVDAAATKVWPVNQDGGSRGSDGCC